MTFPLGIPERDLLQAAEAGHETPAKGSFFEGLTAPQYAVCQFLIKHVREAYDLKIKFENPEALQTVERFTVLSAIDKLWQEHLYNMDSLRNSIGLRAYGQRDPLIEYKVEAKKMFDDLMVSIKSEICHNIFRSASSLMAFEQFLRKLPQQMEHQSTSAFVGAVSSSTGGESKPSDMVTEAAEALSKAKPVRSGPKVGRNDPCPCGSGKKYKHCCGR